jgi:PKD repeat protein
MNRKAMSGLMLILLIASVFGGLSPAKGTEGVAYIIVHALNPEGIEIASIEGISPWDVRIYADGYWIGIGAHDNETYNRPILVNPGNHTIEIEFNGMTLKQDIHLAPGETKILDFEFPRVENTETVINCLTFSSEVTCEYSYPITIKYVPWQHTTTKFFYEEPMEGYLTGEVGGGHQAHYGAAAGGSMYVAFPGGNPNWPDEISYNITVSFSINYDITPERLYVRGDWSLSSDNPPNMVEVDHRGAYLKFYDAIIECSPFPEISEFDNWYVQNTGSDSLYGYTGLGFVDTKYPGAFGKNFSQRSFFPFERGRYYFCRKLDVSTAFDIDGIGVWKIGICKRYWSTLIDGEWVTEEWDSFDRELHIEGMRISSVPYDLLETGIKHRENQPPVASFAYLPEFPAVSEEAIFDASSSYDPDGEIVSYLWDFGDCISDSGEIVTHAYTATGSYSVTLTVVDDDGLTDTVIEDVIVAAAPQPPVASFTFSPENPVAGDEIAFDASSSYDPDGEIASYNWAFNDGNSAEGGSVTHVYARAGAYTPTLTVTDDDGLTGSMSRVIDVKGVPPSIEITDVKMVSPSILGIDAKITSPEGMEDGSIWVRFSALINGKQTETEVVDVRGFVPLRGHHTFSWSDWDTSDDILKIDLEREGVPRFEANQVFDVEGIVYTDSSASDKSVFKDVEVLLPAIIIHGYTYTHKLWGWMLDPIKFTAYDGLIAFLCDNGYTTDDSRYRTLWGPNDCPYQADKHTAESIVSTVDDWVSVAIEETYANKVNLIGHSLGGLVARHYAGISAKANKVIMIGTPHLGVTHFYQQAFAKDTRMEAERILKVPQTDNYNLLLWLEPNYFTSSLLNETGGEIEEPFENSFNPQHNSDVDYYSIFADACEYTPYQLTVEERDDGWYSIKDMSNSVGDNTVLAFSGSAFFGQLPPIGGGTHAHLCEHAEVMNRVLRILTGTQEVATEDVSSIWHSGVIQPSQSISHAISVASELSKAVFGVVWQGSDLDLVLHDPNGREITPEVAAVEFGITFAAGDAYEQYTVLNPASGDWIMELRAIDVPEGGEEYTTFAHVGLYLDTTEPATLLEIGDPRHVDFKGRVFISSATPFTLTSEDDPDGSGVGLTSYRVYNATSFDTGWLPYTYSFHLEDLSDGVYSVEYNSTDNAGNTELSHTVIVTLDDTGPSVDSVTPPAGCALQDGVTFEASAIDAESGVSSVSFSIRDPNGGEGSPVGFDGLPATYNATTDKWTLPFDTLQLPDGYYIVLVKADDNLGHTGSKIVPYSIRNWAVLELLPASESNRAGRTMPVKFSLRVAEAVDPAQPFVYNEELTIRIYEEGQAEDVLQESIFGDAARDYRIDSIGELYITNFRTLKAKPTSYIVDIWRRDMLLGSFEFATIE